MFGSFFLEAGSTSVGGKFELLGFLVPVIFDLSLASRVLTFGRGLLLLVQH